MNILCTIPLLAILMKSVIASDSDPDPFHVCSKNKDAGSLEDLSKYIQESSSPQGHPPHKAIQDEAIVCALDERRNDDELLVSVGKSMLPKKDPGIFKKLMEGTFDSTSKTVTNGSLVVLSETESLHPLKPDEEFNEPFRKRFLMHGDMALVKKITSLKHTYNAHLISTSVMFEVLQQCLDENLHDRFLDLLPIVEKREEGYTETAPNGGTACLSLISTDDGIPLQRFLVSVGDLDGDRQTTFNWFCGELAWAIADGFRNQQVRDFAIVMQALPFKLPREPFVNWFLNLGSATKFVAVVCREFIEEGFNTRKYALGGKEVWKAIWRKFPGEFPEESFTDDDVHAALSRFKTKKQMEDEMRDGMISYLMAVLGYAFLPSYSCGIIVDYAPLLGVNYKPKTNEQSKETGCK